MIKILHTSDIHLGKKLSSLLGSRAEEGRQALKKAFSKSVSLALKEKVNLFLIAGDLFDNNNPSRETIDFVRTEFKKLEKINVPVLILPGTHDCLADNSIYRKVDFAKELSNVFVFLKEETRFYPELDLAVSAKPNLTRSSKNSPLRGLRESFEKKFNIAMGHGSLQIPGKSSEIDYPVTLEEIENSDFNYVALGHWHGAYECPTKKVKAFYAGAPEIIDFRSAKAGNVLIVEVSETGVKVEPKRVGEKYFERIEIDISNVSDILEVEEKILQDSTSNLVREVILKGQRNPDLLAPFSSLEERLKDNLFNLKVIDKTVFKLEDIKVENYPEGLVIGQFVRKMKEKINAAPQSEKPTLEKALELGIHLLEGKENL